MTFQLSLHGYGEVGVRRQFRKAVIVVATKVVFHPLGPRAIYSDSADVRFKTDCYGIDSIWIWFHQGILSLESIVSLAFNIYLFLEMVI
jgi:hypothetical protein